MNILVTGGNGQLGLSLKKISGEYPDCCFRFTDLPECDITDSASVERMLADRPIDMIINCAAYTNVNKAESEPELAAKINCVGAEVLAKVAVRHSIKLIHISTDYVFDGMAHEPICESEEPNPQSVYGRTKLDGERAIARVGCDAAIIRTAWLYSEFGNNFVKTMLKLGRENGCVSVVSDQFGTPTYATDLAKAIMCVATKWTSGLTYYHYTDRGHISWYDFAVEIFRAAGVEATVKKITTAEFPSPAPRPAYSVLDKTKISALGAEVPDWKHSLGECLRLLSASVQ